MLLFSLTSIFIIGLLFAKLLDESAGYTLVPKNSVPHFKKQKWDRAFRGRYTADFNRVLCDRKSKLGMIVGSMGLIGCMFIILLLAVIL